MLITQAHRVLCVLRSLRPSVEYLKTQYPPVQNNAYMVTYSSF